MAEALTYRLLDATDSDLLCQGIERVYGRTYPIPEFYDPRFIRAAITAKKLYSIVALNPAGDVVGCMSTVLEQVGDYTADGSALMIAPQYRGQGIVAQLGHYSVDVYQRLGLGGLHLYALALHDLVQNQSGRAGAVVTGMLPAWFSREARVAGYDYPDARIGAVTLFMPLASLPARSVYLPQRHSEVLQDMYSRLNQPRQFLSPPQAPVAPAETVWEVEDKSVNRQLRLVVGRPGADLPERLLSQMQDSAGTEVFYVDVPLSDPLADTAVEQARELGFFFGALMVDRRGCDRLRLQRYAESVAAPHAMVVASAEGQQLIDYVLADRPAVLADSPADTVS